MWVSKNIGANVELQVKGGDPMALTVQFFANGSPYDLSGLVVSFKVFEPGNPTPVFTLSDGNGISVDVSSISITQAVTLPTAQYYYQLELSDIIALGGLFWVRKRAVDSNPIKVSITNAAPSVEVNVQPKKIASSEGDINTFIAGENLSGGRLVQIINEKVRYYDPTNANNIGLLFGITKQAALINDAIDVQTNGICYLPGQSFTPGAKYYAGTNGILASSPSNLTIVQPIGHAITPDKLVINFQSPIKTI